MIFLTADNPYRLTSTQAYNLTMYLPDFLHSNNFLNFLGS